MLKISRMLMVVVGILFSLLALEPFSIEATAANSKECLDEVNAGVAVLIDPSAYDCDTNKQAMVELQERVQTNEATRQAQSNLFMADVNEVMNVREEPSEEASKVGLLYKDCGGIVLEQVDGWSRIKSGELVGWASNDYLAFGQQAEAMAKDVGFQIAVVEVDTLRLRKEPSTEAKIITLLAKEDTLEVVGEPENGWVAVAYEEDEIGYLSMDCVKLEFQIDSGETLLAIERRKREEALTANRGAIIANPDETRLLAALIQCEAGTVSEEGMLAVGAVVMNRVRSGAYPNTITDVIYASGQFTPALNGKVAKRYHSDIHEACVVAAQRALNGETNVGGATHFRRAGNHEGLLIGGQVFW